MLGFFYFYISVFGPKTSPSLRRVEPKELKSTQNSFNGTVEFFNGPITARSLLVEAIVALGLSTCHTTKQVRA